MRICLLLPELRPSGGISVAVGHAARLDASDEFDVEVAAVHEGGEAPEDVRVVSLAHALDHRYDVVIGTWWETTPWLMRIEAGRRVSLVQSAEERFYSQEEPLERMGAALALAAPVHFFTVAGWLRALLEELRPDVRAWLVPNGIDKAAFAARSAPVAADGPLRILIEGQPSLWFKGVGDTLDAVGRMREPHTTTLIALDPADAPSQEGLRVIGGLSQGEMRAQYEQHDILLKLSRVESLGLPVVEACHVGLPCVVTPYTGHSEVIRHGENGLVTGFDDPDAVAASLDMLARDRTLVRRLSDGAVASMTAWPSADEASATFAQALRDVVSAPEPRAASAATAGFARWAATAAQNRTQRGELAVQTRELEGSIEWLENALEAERAAIVELERAKDDQIESIKNSRTYRLAARLQRLVHLVRR